MKRKLAWLSVVGGFSALGLAASILVPAISAPSGAATLHLCDQNQGGRQHRIDVGRHGFSPGDINTTVAPVYDAKNGKRVGKEIAMFSIVDVQRKKNDASFRIALTLVLGGGKVEVQGAGKFSSIKRGFDFAVTGGTNNFTGAAGSGVARNGRCSGKRGTHITIHLTR